MLIAFQLLYLNLDDNLSHDISKFTFIIVIKEALNNSNDLMCLREEVKEF